MLASLVEHGVRFVVIGGFAALFHGSTSLTFDLDIAPETSADNLDRLSTALDELGAKVRSESGAFAFAHDGSSLARATIWNLTTEHGDLDITFSPSGTQGYEDLHRDAELTEVLGIQVEMASLADVVRSKEAANREKDQLVLPALRKLLDQQGG